MVLHKYIDIIYILELSQATFSKCKLGFGSGFLPRLFWLPIFWLKGKFLKFELSKIWPQSDWATQKPMAHGPNIGSTQHYYIHMSYYLIFGLTDWP